MNPKQSSTSINPIAQLQQDMIEVHRSLNRIESAVMDLRSIILRRNRTASTTRSENRNCSRVQSVVSPTNNVPASIPRTSRSRQLLNDIANRPINNSICWYHRQFGVAANPANCNASCTFLANPNNETLRIASRQSSVANRLDLNSNTAPASVAVESNAQAEIAPVEIQEQMAIEDDLLNLSDTE